MIHHCLIDLFLVDAVPCLCRFTVSFNLMHQYIIWILDVSPTVNKCIQFSITCLQKEQADILYYVIFIYIHYEIYLHPSAVGSGQFTIHNPPRASSCFGHESSAQQRARRRGEKWEWGLGGSFCVQGSLALFPLWQPLCPPPPPPTTKHMTRLKPKTPALLMWFLCGSHICHSSTVFFYFTYLRLSRLQLAWNFVLHISWGILFCFCKSKWTSNQLSRPWWFKTFKLPTRWINKFDIAVAFKNINKYNNKDIYF